MIFNSLNIKMIKVTFFQLKSSCVWKESCKVQEMHKTISGGTSD